MCTAVKIINVSNLKSSLDLHALSVSSQSAIVTHSSILIFVRFYAMLDKTWLFRGIIFGFTNLIFDFTTRGHTHHDNQL